VATGYFDSSAFVKLLIVEPGSDLAEGLWNSCDVVVSSRLAYPEVRAAIAAAGRSGRLSPKAEGRSESAWARFWPAVRPVELSRTVMRRAGELAGAHALRGADAVHLASLLALDLEDTLFVAWDQRLWSGAQAVGAQVAPAT
jgi:predicted nucleic acid-binding protein